MELESLLIGFLGGVVLHFIFPKAIQFYDERFRGNKK